MNLIKNNPFIRLLSLWISGILLSNYIPQSLYLLLIAGILLGIYNLFLFREKNYPYDLVNSLFLNVIVLVLAISFGFQLKPKQIPGGINGYFSATILEAPLEKPNSFQLNVQILPLNSSQTTQTKAIIYAQKNSKIEKLSIGEKLYCKGRLQRIRNNGNPFEFDYANYLAKQGYYFSGYLKASAIVSSGEVYLSPTLWAEKLRNTLLQKLKKHIQSAESIQVISALTLGYRRELSHEVRSHFAATGAMHVLAVSGLHVGMIFLFLSQLLIFLKRTRKGRLLHVLIIATILWFYALLTGFSPSVQRATVMFTFILIGNNLKRPVSIYNSLAASAFLLLLFNRNLLFEVGFQLSYMAVISIVFFYPRLEKLWTAKHWIFQKMWQLTCVSIAAQLGTFALSIFYFHQFPVYFWLSNFVVIPAAYLILGFTFLFFAFSWLVPLTTIAAFLLEGITQTTITALSIIQQLPSSLIRNLSISAAQLLSLVLITFFFMFFLKWKRKPFFFSMLIGILLFLGIGLYNKMELFNQHKLIIYNTDYWLIHLVDGRKNILLYDDENKPSPYLFQNVVTQLQLDSPVFHPLKTPQKSEEKQPSQSKEFIQNSDLIIQLKSPVELRILTTHQTRPMVIFRNKKHISHTIPDSCLIMHNKAFVIDF